MATAPESTGLCQESEFIYPALILDVLSRRIIGWNPDRTLASRLGTEQWKWRSRRGNLYPDWCTTPIEAFNTLRRSTFAILKQHAMARSMGGHRTGSSSGFSRGGSDIDDRKCQGKRNAGSCKNHSDEVSRRQTHDEQWHTLTRFWKERNRLEGIGVCSRFAASFPVSSREKELSSHPAIVEPPP